MSKIRIAEIPYKKIVSVCALVFIFFGCSKVDGSSAPKTTKNELELSAWIPEWQWESGLTDYRGLTKKLTSIQVFAAYFDSTDHLFFSKKSIEAIPEIMDVATEGSLVNVDLTLVNDQFNEDFSSAIQKDSDLITRLMATGESRRLHIEDIVNTVSKYNFSGVEIDYEKIKAEDWENLCLFFGDLYERLQMDGKSLRIVLETRAPIEEINLPVGPVYVMMAYNLYGAHSGPGPKADHAYIAKVAEMMNQIPGDHFIALAAGGFDWSSEGKVTQVTEKEATELKRMSINEPKRDKASGSVYFDYLDNMNTKHTVWYADDVTLAQWIESTKKAGYYKIAIWKTGGFEQATLDYLNK